MHCSKGCNNASKYTQNERRHSTAFGVTETTETDFRVFIFPFVDLANVIEEGLNPPRSFNSVSAARNQLSGDPNCELFPQDPIIPVPPSTPLCRPVGAVENNLVVFPSRNAKRKPPNQEVRRPLFPLFRWWLYPAAMPKQYRAVLGSTKTRVQKPVPAIPTLSRSFVAASFQSTPVGSSALTVVPRNPATCCRMGVWDNTWDNAGNFSAAEGSQFRFCPGDRNEQVLGFGTTRNG